MTLGKISAHFESGSTARGVATITYNPKDPGGKSYGKYQLAARTGTLKRYIAWSKFNDKFKDTPLASAEFDKVWIELSADPEFEQEQQEYIELTHFKPVQSYAASLGYDITNEALNEALFSIGVQHGGYKKILLAATKYRLSAVPKVKEDIENLYIARTMYVNNLSLPDTMNKALRKRYREELKMVLTLYTNLEAPDQTQTATEIQSDTQEA